MWSQECQQPQYYGPLPRMTDTTTTVTDQPIRGQYTANWPIRGRMGSDDELISGNNTNWAAVASIPPLFIQSSLWRLKESQELIKYKLASLGTNLLTWKLNSEARSGELKKSISLLEMVRRESITVMWIYHNQDVCGINQKLFEYHT